MEKLSSKKLAEIVGSASKIVEVDILDVSTDSRKAGKGMAFIAVKGENIDGHDYAKSALDNGAELVIVDRILTNIPTQRQLVVANTVEAYGKIGAYNRSLYQGVVIGLTGSAGKTTTKEEIKFALSKFGKTYASSGNFNNHIGVPYSLCNLEMDAKFAVIEMGMSSKGEISKLVSYVKPDVALITNVYPMHIEFFENFEAIAEAKAEIFEGLKRGGIAIINEDTNFADLLEKRANEHGALVVKFGKNNHYQGKLSLEQDSEAQLYNAWATLKVIEILKLDVNSAADFLKDFGALPGRGKIHKLKLKKGGEYTLIDDSYSGQPEAMKIAIKNLNNMNTNGRKIALLGKMAELGSTSVEQHIAIGKLLADTDIDVVIGVKPEMKDMLAQLPAKIQQYYFDDKEGVSDFLLNKLLQNNDILLIKGARYSSKLYQVADILLQA